MGEKTLSSEKKFTKFNVPPSSEKDSKKKDVKGTNSKPHRHAKVRRTVKLPRLKLENLVVQVSEENTHDEVPTGPAVGNEGW